MTLTGDADLTFIGNALAAMRNPRNRLLACRKACVGSRGPLNGVSVEQRVVGDQQERMAENGEVEIAGLLRRERQLKSGGCGVCDVRRSEGIDSAIAQITRL